MHLIDDCQQEDYSACVITMEFVRSLIAHVVDNHDPGDARYRVWYVDGSLLCIGENPLDMSKMCPIGFSEGVPFDAGSLGETEEVISFDALPFSVRLFIQKMMQDTYRNWIIENAHVSIPILQSKIARRS